MFRSRGRSRPSPTLRPLCKLLRKFKSFKPFKLFKTIAGLFDDLNDLNGLNDLNATLYSSSVLGANSSSNFNFFLVNPCSNE